MRRALFRIYWWFEKRIAPRLRYSQYHYLDVLRDWIPDECVWLDLGCGHQMFAPWMEEERELARRAKRLVGVDLDVEGIAKHQTIQEKAIANILQLPFGPESFDVVTANMVMEHVTDPNKLLAEAHRILKPNGLFIFHTPNRKCIPIRIARRVPQSIKNRITVVLQDRREEDIFPAFYRLNTTTEIADAADRSDFNVEAVQSVSSSAITGPLGPLAVPELFYLRLLELPKLTGLRSSLIAILRKR